MLQPGQEVGRFVVEAMLGEGGMAAVYRVRHQTLESQHALKLLKMSGAGIRERLVLEGQVQASLRHPNIVAVTDVIFVGDQPGLVMELVDGPTLDAWLCEQNPSLEEREHVFRGVLAGVWRAHRAGLVHRDLKPGNVLLDSADGVIIPKVTDFGLAKILVDEEGGHARTRTGTTMGTPQYMAPEQMRDAKSVDPRADIWALGCILYQLYTGRPPFWDEDVIALYAAVGDGRYTPPEALYPAIPARVAEAIRGCLVVDRERRIPDCETLRKVLSGESGGEHVASSDLRRPLAPPPAPVRVPSAPSAPRRQRWAALAALGVLGLVGSAGALLALAADGVQPARKGEATATPATEAPSPVVVTTVRRSSPAPVEAAAPAPRTPRGGSRTIPSTPDGSIGRAETEEPTPAAPTPAEPTARVRVTGDAERVLLSAGGRTHRPGELPAGTYTATVTFAGREPLELGPYALEAGADRTLNCVAAFANCSLQ